MQASAAARSARRVRSTVESTRLVQQVQDAILLADADLRKRELAAAAVKDAETKCAAQLKAKGKTGPGGKPPFDPKAKQRQEDYELAMSAARAALKKNNYTGAINAYKEALRLMPGDKTATTEYDSVVRIQKAEQARLEKARAAEEAKKPASPPPVNPQAEFDKCIKQGTALEKQGKYKEAVAVYQQALKWVGKPPAGDCASVQGVVGSWPIGARRQALRGGREGPRRSTEAHAQPARRHGGVETGESEQAVTQETSPMLKNLFALVVSAIVITGAVYLYHHRNELFRPNFDRTGGTLVVFEIDGDPPAGGLKGVTEVLQNRFDPKGTLGIVVRADGDNRVAIGVPEGKSHDDLVETVKRVAPLPGLLQLRMVANQIDDEAAWTAAHERMATAKLDAPPPPLRDASGGEELPMKMPERPLIAIAGCR